MFEFLAITFIEVFGSIANHKSLKRSQARIKAKKDTAEKAETENKSTNT